MRMPARDSETWRIVIVDNSADERADLRRLLLRGSGRRYEFIEAETAADGIRAIRSLVRPPECALVEYNLHDGDAHDVLAECGTLESPICPVLVVTSDASSKQGRELLHAGAQDFLEKNSLSAHSLTRAVENAVERHRLLTKLWEREAVIRENEARLRLALEASNTGMWTWDLETDRVTWSPEIYAILEVTEGDFNGTGAAFFEMVHPEDRARVETAVRDAIAHGTLYECEFRLIRPGGGSVWVENRGRARQQPLSMLGTVTDISRRKDMELQLERKEFELRTLTDNTPDILTRFDRDLRHIYVNAAIERSTGLARETFIGKTNRELGMPDALCAQWEAALLAAFETKADQFIKFAYEGPAGTQHYEARIVAEIGRDGRVDQVLVVTHDVTERERYEQALRDAARRKDEFLATLAHELRNPMAPIRTGIDVLKLIQSPDDRTKTLATMERQMSHMVRLVDDLMDVSRIRRGVIQLERERVRLGTIVEAALESSQGHVRANGHELAVQLPEEPIWIEGDPVRLAQVLGNLINNSAKYTPCGGHIRLTAALEGNQVAIAVADDGIGISAQDLPHVFDLFSQCSESLGRSQGGLGIGLSLVQQLVALHDGSVDAQSAGPGQGSVFTVRLPVAAGVSSSALGSRASERITIERPESRRILVVDDNDDAAELLAEMLRLAGHVTCVAHDGPTAIETALTFSPDVVFLDLGMPGADGYAVARSLRGEGAHDGVVLVALTGWGGSEDKRRTAEAGFDFHLTKPVQFALVRDILARIQAGRGRRSGGSELLEASVAQP